MQTTEATRQAPLPLKGYLVNQGVTLIDFAARISRTPTYVSSVLSRRLPLTRPFAMTVVRTLGLDLDQTELLLGHPSTWTKGR